MKLREGDFVTFRPGTLRVTGVSNDGSVARVGYVGDPDDASTMVVEVADLRLIGQHPDRQMPMPRAKPAPEGADVGCQLRQPTSHNQHKRETTP